MNRTTVEEGTDPAIQLSSHSALALLRRMEWRVRHAVENVLSGEYRSAFRGRGMEFDQVVKYEFGDDVRDIDWNVTARLGEPYRKKFVEEREVTLLLVFEDSPSLQFGSSELSKREALLELAGLVMLLGAVNRDRVGYVYAAPGGYHLKEPVRGRGPILHAASTLLGMPAPGLQHRRGAPADTAHGLSTAPFNAPGLSTPPIIALDRQESPGLRSSCGDRGLRSASATGNPLAAPGPLRSAPQHCHLAVRLFPTGGAGRLGRPAPAL